MRSFSPRCKEKVAVLHSGQGRRRRRVRRRRRNGEEREGKGDEGTGRKELNAEQSRCQHCIRMSRI